MGPSDTHGPDRRVATADCAQRVGPSTPVAAFDIHRQTNRHLVLFHAVTRTLLVTACWYLFPTQRFTVIPAVIVAVYAVTIVVLEQRWRALHAPVGHQRDFARV